MAMETQVQTLHDDVRNVVMQLIGRSDGEGGQETNVRKVDVSELAPPCGTVKIYKITYDVSDGVVNLAWDALTPEDFIRLSGQGEFDYCREGGLQNKGGPSATGDILLSTLGFELNSTYSIKLEMKKKGVAR